jgi:hypothetical protein
LLAFMVAIPANEIVVLTILTISTGTGMMVQMEGTGGLRHRSREWAPVGAPMPRGLAIAATPPVGTAARLPG